MLNRLRHSAKKLKPLIGSIRVVDILAKPPNIQKLHVIIVTHSQAKKKRRRREVVGAWAVEVNTPAYHWGHISQDSFWSLGTRI
jgi:hypothetical protein